MVRAGEEHKHAGIVVQIVEVLPFHTVSGRGELMIAYRIKDGKYTSPVAHFWMSVRDDIRPKIKQVADYYVQVRGSLR